LDAKTLARISGWISGFDIRRPYPGFWRSRRSDRTVDASGDQTVPSKRTYLRLGCPSRHVAGCSTPALVDSQLPINRRLGSIARLTGVDPEAIHEPPRDGDIR
jgi:hypothetical protein